jgi:hypothetical protein
MFKSKPSTKVAWERCAVSSDNVAKCMYVCNMIFIL